MIEAKNIHDMNHVKEILDNLKKYVSAYEKQIGELPEDICENITFQLAEIDEFIIGPQKWTSSNMACVDIRLFEYWQYINGKIKFNKLLEKLRKNEGEV